jgi:hypothetical protein
LWQEQTGAVVVGGTVGLPKHIDTGQIGCPRHSDLVLSRRLLFQSSPDSRILALRQCQRLCKRKGRVSGNRSHGLRWNRPRGQTEQRNNESSHEIGFPPEVWCCCIEESYHRTSIVLNIDIGI